MIYNAVIPIKKLMKICAHDEKIILSGKAPEYVIKMWINEIQGIESKKIDIMSIRKSDMIEYLEHIIRYPTYNINIEDQQFMLIEYLEQNPEFKNINMMYLKELSIKCALKILYLYLNFKKNL